MFSQWREANLEMQFATGKKYQVEKAFHRFLDCCGGTSLEASNNQGVSRNFIPSPFNPSDNGHIKIISHSVTMQTNFFSDAVVFCYLRLGFALLNISLTGQKVCMASPGSLEELESNEGSFFSPFIFFSPLAYE
jgi:hypothetical protein